MMSLSLLNEYLSSDDDDVEDSTPSIPDKPTDKKKSRKNFFICDSSSEDSSSDNDVRFEESASNAKTRLPRPFEGQLTDTSSVSVFRNPFLEAERAETKTLEQHVKLSEIGSVERSKDRRSSIPCRQFKRGRCKLAEKCRFLHVAFSNAAGTSADSSQPPTTAEYGGKAVRYTEWGGEEIVESPSDSDANRKRNRVGTTNSLVPPKRALTNYGKQRREEAPWLFDK